MQWGTGGLACLMLASGCFYVGTTTETSRTDLPSGATRKPIGRPMLMTRMRALGPALEVRGIWQQTCWESGVQRTQVTRTQSAKVKVGDPCSGASGSSCGIAALMSLGAAPFTLLVSAAFTSARLRGNRTQLSVEETRTPSRVVRCDRPASGLAVEVTLTAEPGHPSQRIVLDRDGVGRLPLSHPAAATGAVVTVAP